MTISESIVTRLSSLESTPPLLTLDIMPAKRVLIGFGVDIDAVAGWWVNAYSTFDRMLTKSTFIGLDLMAEKVDLLTSQ